MKIDESEKEIHISVRELAFGFPPSYGYSPIPTRVRMAMGQEVHQTHQKKAKKKIDLIEREKTTDFEDKDELSLKYQFDTQYQAEKHVKFTTTVDEWTIILTGRVDGFYEVGEEVVIEEIKSVMNLGTFDMTSSSTKAYVLQLQLYGYIFKEWGKKVRCHLVLVELVSQNTEIIEIPFEDQTQFIRDRVHEILTYWHTEQQLKHDQRSRASTLRFPFANYRPEQDKIIEHVKNTINNGKRLIVSAPSGLGKTVGTLYPTIKLGLKKNLRVFVATSKTTQQKIYKDTLQRMVKKGANIRAIILTAKEKVCMNSEYICDPQFCHLLENYSNQDISEAIEELLSKKVIEARDIKEKAEEIEICPFELSLDTSLLCDAIVGDYNYIFHPSVLLRRYFEKPYNNSVLIIDESHNLPFRAMDYYSPIISLRSIWEVENHLRSLSLTEKSLEAGLNQLEELYLYIQGLTEYTRDFNKRRCGIVPLDQKKVIKIQKNVDRFVIEFVREFNNQYSHPPPPQDPLLTFAGDLRWFQNVLEESQTREFSYIYDADNGILKILCKCAAPKLAQRIKGFHAVIAQSATLTPLDYFQEMLGFPKDTQMTEYPSPFPAKNRLYLTYPYVSTRYKERERFFSRIAHVIRDCIIIRPGNYLVFFPSFSVLEEVHKELIKLELKVELLIQEREMSDRKRRRFLRRLKQIKKGNLLLGVHGGIFSEGVDYPSEMAVGVFIIGPGLPMFSFEQELIKNYFQDLYGKGFEYAYRNIGMNRVIQAAGRIFRSEKDKGFVLLMGKRFTNPYYRSVFPKDWIIEKAVDPIKKISEFWKNVGDS
ncbi:MAG: ATP-dependent DNA helicase [Promethearchaeota archaeon]